MAEQQQSLTQATIPATTIWTITKETATMQAMIVPTAIGYRLVYVLTSDGGSSDRSESSYIELDTALGAAERRRNDLTSIGWSVVPKVG